MRAMKAILATSAVFMLVFFGPRAGRAEYATIRGTPVTQGQMRVAEQDMEHIQKAQPAATDQFVLKQTRVEAEISGVLARVRVEQEFVNPYSERLEAIYVFPLPEDAAVDRYWFQVQEKVIRGVVKERSAARREYEQAKTQGRKAALLEQERPDIFTQSVANIPPKQSVTVHLEYVHPVQIDSGRYLFRFPMVVGPRFIPGQALGSPSVGRGWSPDTDEVRDASRITPEPLPQGMRSGNDVKICIKLDAGMPIRNMTGVTHELAIKKEGETKAVVDLKNQVAIPDKDFVFEYCLAGEETTIASLAHRGTAEGYFALMLQPKGKIEKAELAPREVVLLLDTSGSMNGPSIGQLRIFAQHVLERLNPQDTFRIVSFNNGAQAFRHEALAPTPENIDQGKAFIRSLQASGGTMMLPALQTALSPDGSEQRRARYLVLVTDALVGNDDAILGYLRQPQLADVRVFPVAVGAAPNHYLISRAAELGRGFAMQITNQDNPTEMARRFNEKMGAPVLTDLEIDWGRLKVRDLAPEVLPDLHAGRPLLIMGRYDQAGKSEITLKANMQGQAIKTSLTVTLPEKMPDHGSLGPIWAGQRIRQIWNRNVGKETKESREAITQLGLTHQLVTRYTSFVAVETDAQALQGNLRTETVQPMLPEGMTDAALGFDRRARRTNSPAAAAQVSAPSSSPATAGSNRPVDASAAPSPAPSQASPAVSRPGGAASHHGGGGGAVEWLFLAALGALCGGRMLRTRGKQAGE